jgi:hypothetical protein
MKTNIDRKEATEGLSSVLYIAVTWPGPWPSQVTRSLVTGSTSRLTVKLWAQYNNKKYTVH